jgi:hypothetical protein
MNDNKESRNTIYYLQKRIVELSREYYQAIKNNITFENIKVIFLKRKKLKEELSSIKQNQDNGNENYEEENVNSSLSLHD